MTYQELVNLRKNYQLEIPGLINPVDINSGRFDEGCYLEPWATWHNNIPADIMLIGQDWGGMKYYIDNKGRDTPNNPTCKNLMVLFSEIGIDTGSPTRPSAAKLHFTNIIPFIRTDKMQGSLDFILNQDQINELANVFIMPLINIVKPKIIITLGLSSYKAIMSIFDKPYSKSEPLKKLIEQSPIDLPDNFLFPMYHCGASTINRNRNLNQQKDDWLKIKHYLNNVLCD